MLLRCRASVVSAALELAVHQEAIYERASKSAAWSARLTRMRWRSGASPRRSLSRPPKRAERPTRNRHPNVGGLILALSDDPQGTKAWASDAKGEVALGVRLDKQVSESIAVMHYRRIPGTKTNFDHIVVTRGGVFVVDAKRYLDQRPALRVEGGILRPRLEKLMVGGRDLTKLVDGVLDQAERWFCPG
jgi:hypothetical protein